MREISLHLLDLAENSIAAGSKTIQLLVEDDHSSDRLHLSVIDDGDGMDSKMVALVTDPFVTTRTTRKVGLGIPLLKAAAEAANGYLKIYSELGKGTKIVVEFQSSHIDRMPLGDLPATWLTLLISSPAIHWIFKYRLDETSFEFDNDFIMNEIGDIPLTDPMILGFLRQLLENGIAELKPNLMVQ